MSATDLYDMAVELLEHVNVALATTTDGAIDRAFVCPTLPVLDCCPQLTVDIRQPAALEVTGTLGPAAAGGHRGVINALFLTGLVATIARCIPILDDNRLPDPTEMEASANQLSQDAWATWNHLWCLRRAGELFGGTCEPLYIDPPVPLVAQGGCAGWVFTVRAAVAGYCPVS